MRIAIGSDHAAYECKEAVKQFLESMGHAITDVGTDTTDSCDYPDYAAAVSKQVQSGVVHRGILICGTGIGMSIAANRFKRVRAALCYTEELATLSRLHNDANVLCMGARTQSMSSMQTIMQSWLSTEWEGDRHATRLLKIEQNVEG
jgi:ribose 5-phosphate isomerase B